MVVTKIDKLNKYLYYKKSKDLTLSFNATGEDPCECDTLVKFQKKVEDALQALNKKYILYGD